MPHPVQTDRSVRREDTFARKARILLDLFGPSGVERLRQAGLQTGAGTDVEDTQDWSVADADRRALLERFRRQGLFEAEAQQQHGAMTSAPQTASLTARIADHLDEAALDKEHPAIIATVLRSQSKALQRQALHALPGPVARATIRFLRG